MPSLRTRQKIAYLAWTALIAWGAIVAWQQDHSSAGTAGLFGVWLVGCVAILFAGHLPGSGR